MTNREKWEKYLQEIEKKKALRKKKKLKELTKKWKWKMNQNKDLIKDFEELKANDSIRLVSISNKYGFTLEYARQLFEKIFGYKYTILKKKRINKRHKKEERIKGIQRNPKNKIINYPKESTVWKGAQSENKVMCICKKLGYNCKPFQNQKIDLIINNFYVDIKSDSNGQLTSLGQKTRTYQFSISPYQYENTHFIICHMVSLNNFFIIPTKEINKSRTIYIPETPEQQWYTGKHQITRKSKWWKYLDRWDLLATSIKINL